MSDFEELYYALRYKENRIYSDAEVAQLPDIAASHIYFNEWKIRKASCRRLLKFLHKKKKNLAILEVGCGNGWLSAKMAKIPGSVVTGIDKNTAELLQAKNVFAGAKNLRFRNALIEDEIRAGNKYDIIVFAASIQYFSSLKNILNQAFSILKADGEIHILDTHFYKESELNSAKERSRKYFESMGFSNMSAFYHHHLLRELSAVDFKVLYNPKSILNKILLRKNPFYWIKIRKQK